MILYIVCSSICPLGFASEYVSLGITNSSFSARLSVRWGRRAESLFRGDTCDLLHCPLVVLSFGVGEWMLRFGDHKFFLFWSSVSPLGHESRIVISGDNYDLLHYPLVDLSFGVGEWIRRFVDSKYFLFFSSVCSLGQESRIVISGENCDLLHCPLIDLSFRVGDWIRRFGDYYISFSPRLSVRWGRRVES